MRFIVAAIFVFVSGPLLADEPPRKIDFKVILTGPDGAFKDCKRASDDAKSCAEFTDLTLGRMCLTAASRPQSGVSAPDQYAHGRLATKIYEAMSQSGELSLSAEDISFLKAAIAKLDYNTMAVYQATKLLDPTVDK